EKAEEYYEYVKESADMNFVRWDVLGEKHQWETPNTANTYRGEVDFVKTYLEKRAEWIERIMNGDMATSNLGTEFNPIPVGSSEDFKKFRDFVNGGESCMGYYFVQTADIDLDGEEFVPIGTNTDGFMGNYNGNGYSIKNLKITDASIKEGMFSAGLFAKINGGEINNVIIESGIVDVSAREAGAIAGRAIASKIYNCINKADVTNRYSDEGQMTGGIVGYFAGGNSNYLVNCANTGRIDGIGATDAATAKGIGGIAGHVGSGCAVSGCVNMGKVTAGFGTEGFVGGIVGELSGKRPRVSYVYWLKGENGNENGHGYNAVEETQPSYGTFSGMGMTKEELLSEEFVLEINKNFVNISTSGGTSYVNLKMWELKKESILPTGELATLEKLPKIKPEWVFSDRSALMKWLRSVTGAKVTLNNDGTIDVKPENRDPILSASLVANEMFDADELKFVAVKMKVKSKVDNGAIFFGTDKHPGPKGEHHSRFEVINDGYWHDYIIDMSSFEHDLWHGNVYLFRFDPINAEDLDAKINIERIGIFKTSEEAQAFLDKSTKNVGFLADSIQKVIIPENIGDFKATQTDFMLKNNEAGARPNERAQIVVAYVDNGGNESIIPVCFTDSEMFTTYIAIKPGKYKLTYNYKAYDDISGHWAEEYIDFSSARGLFAGTSPTEFSPDQTMTRGMFITVLGRMHGADTSMYDGRKTGYDDIKGTEYYASYVGWAAENGIIKTFEDRSFYADSPISRKDMAIMLYRYVQAFAAREVKETSEKIIFDDITSLGTETVTAIETIQKYGIINGKGAGRFDPFGYSTRAEVATVMSRLIKSILGVMQ
ncbi:MAG: S-layer homology domain-containing protein, partial [Clostridia bacterium]|nr:S-layer homology domain-containing protein [Clostridia bacterium]